MRAAAAAEQLRVLGRVVFLARQERVAEPGRALRRAMLRADDESDEDEDEDEDEHPASSGGVSGAVAKAAIMAPAARFPAPSAGPRWRRRPSTKGNARRALAHHRLGWCIVDGVDPRALRRDGCGDQGSKSQPQGGC